MLCRGREVQSWTDYIMVTDRRLIHNMLVWDAWHNTYNYLVLGFLRRSTPTKHLQYLVRQRIFPIYLKKAPGGVDRMFSEIWWGIPKPPHLDLPHQVWISPETRSLIDTSI